MKKTNRKKYQDPKLIGITGGIGSGQTTVANIFKNLGCKVINVDEKAKQAIKRDASLRKELREEFGNAIFTRDGKLNRKKLASIVFNDPDQLKKLNRMVHPRMVSSVVEEMETARFSGKYPLVIVDAALIYEIHIEQLFDYIIVVYTGLNKRISRLKERDNMDRAEAMVRIRQQLPLEEKKDWADFVIDNNRSVQELEKQVKHLFNVLIRDVKPTPVRPVRTRKMPSN